MTRSCGSPPLVLASVVGLPTPVLVEPRHAARNSEIQRAPSAPPANALTLSDGRPPLVEALL